MRKTFRALSFFMVLAILSGLGSSCTPAKPEETEKVYGVFLSLNEDDLDHIKGYQTVVIDAQAFSPEAIAELKQGGSRVLSYINLGSVENFRDYYAQFNDLFLGPYENWPEEQWVDPRAPRWQAFITQTLATDLVQRGIDGFFVDNCDVYSIVPSDESLEGLGTMLKALRAYNLPVIINGGDTFVDAWFAKYADLEELMTGINQETVFSSIDFAHRRFGQQNAEDSRYYRDYIERYAPLGMEIFLLEYSKDPLLKQKIADYCAEHGFSYYISASIELK